MVNPAERNSGKPNTETSIQHFSHEHQLLLLNLKKHPNLNMDSCEGCKLKPSKWVYACEPCNFILHIPCSQMPKLINHPADPNHTFTLLAHPAYPSGLFRCDACGDNGDAFNYHCSTCGLDIHTICATMPLSLAHQTHPCPLNLVFTPHTSQDFSCDVCHGQGSNHWVYRCNPCGFSAHLNCATYKSSSSSSTPSTSLPQIRSIVHPHSQPQIPLYQQPQSPSMSSISHHQTQSLVHPQPQPQSPVYQQSQPQRSSTPSVSHHRTRSLVLPQSQSPLYQQSQPQIPLYRQQSFQPAQASTAEHIYRQHYLQPARVSTLEQARQNFIRDYMAAQQADQARIVIILQNNNGVMDAAQLQNLYNNSATGAVIQQYLQITMGANNSDINPMTQQYLQGMLASGNQLDPNLLASMIGSNNGGGGIGAGQQFNQGFMQNRFGGGNAGGPNFLQKILGGGGPGSNGGSSFLRLLFGGF